jgi:molybdate transport system substrate-binding protein
MSRNVIASLLMVLTVALAACSPQAAPAAPATLTVFAAASLTEAFTQIGKDFEAAYPGVTVAFNFAASNQLAQQIEQGAPADVFASANKTQMEVAISSGRIESGTEQTFVRNRLVVVFPQDNPGEIGTLQDLARPGLQLVLAVKEVPAGQYSLDFLDKAIADPAFGASFKDAVLANVASYEENVRAVLTKVALGEADAGIVYTSDINSQAAEDVDRLDIPDTLNTIANYPIAPLKDSEQAGTAQAFVDYVLAPAGQTVLASFGFIPTMVELK